jgi:hypothetical protein
MARDDVPSTAMSATGSLPHVDEHSAQVLAGTGETWSALLRVVEGSVSAPGAVGFARVLGCADTAAAGPRPLAAGSAITGFHVDAAEEPRELALAGRHRFSEYALVFRLDDLGAAGTRLRAETRAAFPGLRGRLYRALVIGTRGHVVVTRRLLDATKRRAERG